VSSPDDASIEDPLQRRRPKPFRIPPANRPGAVHAATVPGVSGSPASTARHAALPSRSSGHTAQRRRRGRQRSRAWRALRIAASFTVLLALAAGGVASYAYQKYNGQITRVAVLQTNDKNIRDAARQQNAANFLVIGSDSRAGITSSFGNVSGARSDTAMLVHLSPDRSKATIISIPRDSWVEIPDCKGADGQTIPAHSDMFNSAFTVGGPACTISTIQKLTGIAVTHFLELDFSGFQSMVSALGTVAVCSPQTVWDQGSGLRLHVGINHLDGAQALAYVRARETLGDGSDLGRIRRQQIFLSAVLRQAMNGSLLSNPARLTSFLDAATRAITVDKGTTFSDLRTLASSLQGLNPKRVTFYTAPIANPNYTPPGTTMTGRVLLDTSQGRSLYDSVITDTKPVWVSGSNSKLVSGPQSAQSPHPGATTSTATPASAPPNASLNAADSTCSL
jgi:LCP family protein required for cell wall assembly